MGMQLNHAMRRALGVMFQGYFPTDTKHNRHYKDYGYPENLEFAHFKQMYDRNGIAAAGIERIVDKVWETNPWLLQESRNKDTGDVHVETAIEAEARKAFDRVELWSVMREVHARARVGRFAALLLRIGDDLQLREPAAGARGLDALVSVHAVWEGQLRVSIWDEDQTSQNYGSPLMYEYTEETPNGVTRTIDVHPSRLVIWSQDGRINTGKYALAAGFNDLVTLEKVNGAGGEGFWKNAKSAPVLNVDKDAELSKLALLLGAEDESQIAEKMGEVVGDWQEGFDKLLMLQGIETKSLGITLPQPSEFRDGPLQSFAASLPCPLKVLLGSQTGERASTEDSKEWSRTGMSVRLRFVIPNIKRTLKALTAAGVLPPAEWIVDWDDLTAPDGKDKQERAKTMAAIRKDLMGSGEIVFEEAEIREVMGYEPRAETATLGEDDADPAKPLGDDEVDA